jgi:hypothetical protein
MNSSFWSWSTFGYSNNLFNNNNYNKYFSSSVINMTDHSIDPHYISGLTQSDGSFFVTL